MCGSGKKGEAQQERETYLAGVPCAEGEGTGERVVTNTRSSAGRASELGEAQGFWKLLVAHRVFTRATGRVRCGKVGFGSVGDRRPHTMPSSCTTTSLETWLCLHLRHRAM